MPIDLAAVDWLYVVVLAIFVFLASFVGNVLSFNHRGMAALLSALAFAALFVAWAYYPHGLPLPTSLSVQKAAVGKAAPAAVPAPVTPQRPRNPVTDITPPANN